MRKSTFVKTLCRYANLCGFIALGLFSLPASAQVAAPASASAPTTDKITPATAMPRNPRKLVQMASNFNGITSPDMKPWHLKATFIRFDVMGNAIDHGTYEEFWASPTKHTHIFTGTTFKRVVYHTKKGALHTGTIENTPDLVGMMRLGFVDPLPDKSWPQYASLTMQQQDMKGAALACVSGGPAQAHTLTEKMSGFTLCFDADRPLLRATVDSWNFPVFRNNFINFNGRYVPRDLQMGRPEKIELTAHLESLEELKTINESDFVAPADASASRDIGEVYLPQAEAKKLQIGSVEPAYPPAAVAAHVIGTVHVRGTINPDGHVLDLHVLDGPLLLQQAALDAVSKYIFKPYYQYGEVWYVGTVFQVDFPETVKKK